jgi:DNA-binding CsgD family transcriptional regulator
MFHSLSSLAPPALAQPAADWSALPTPMAYRGPDRRSPCPADAAAAGRGGASGSSRASANTSRSGNTPALRYPADLCPWLASMLDEVDYGMLLVDAEAQVLHINHCAQNELDAHHPLQLMGRSLRAHLPQDVAPLYDALAGAQRGLRRLLPLGQGARRVYVSVVPVSTLPGDPHMGIANPDDPASNNPPRAALLVMGKQELCSSLSVRGFARCHHLTNTETRVLQLVCDGVPPGRIAQLQGVALCTVRTQISSIRGKTASASIRQLVQQVAVLPPLVGALRQTAAGAGAS